MIPRNFKIDLLGRVNIVDIIDQYVPLKKTGGNYVACCPFHQEKTPSFTVSAEKQFYYCFGCGAHGDVITFTMEHLSLDYVGAVEKLAAGAGLTVPREENTRDFARYQSERREEEDLSLLNRFLADYFQEQLAAAETAQSYLTNRGLPAAISRRYELGFAPKKNYYDDIKAKYPLNSYTAGGIVTVKDGQVFPRFRDRIIFPIKDSEGKIIGFGGRIIAAGEPKYLNSPETLLFNKGQCLYGLFEAKSAVKKAGYALVTEGYMDVLSLAAAGVDYAVATLGTATTGEHIRLLFRFAANLYFCFDGDAAGRRAAWRALVNAMEYLRDDKVLFFVFLPENEDPDSFVRAKGKAGFEQFVDQEKISLSQYFVGHLLADKNLAQAEVKAQIITAAKAILAKVRAPNLHFLLIQSLAGKLNIPLAELKALLGAVSVSGGNAYRPKKLSGNLPPLPVKPKDIKMLGWLLINPKLASHVALPDYAEYSSGVQCLLTLAAKISSHKEAKSPPQLTELMHDTPYYELTAQALKETFTGGGSENTLNIEEEFKKGLKKIQLEIIQADENALKLILRDKYRDLTAAENTLLPKLLQLKQLLKS